MTGDCTLVTRRRFVQGLGATVAVVAAGRYGISVWGRNPALAAPAPAPGAWPAPGGRTLVVVEMGGGNDGLNMVVPHHSGAYHDLRGELAITDPLDLDGAVGFHPALESLAARYRAGAVAIVEGVGYPDPDLSHFASLSTWWSADPASVGATGWLGRWLDGAVGGGDPLAAVAVGPGPAPALVGENSFVVTVQDERGLAPDLPPWVDDPDELVAAWAGFAAAPMDSPGMLGSVRDAIGATAAARERLSAALGPASATDPAPEPRRGRGSLAGYLDVAAQLIVAPEVAPAVVYVHGFGDFDTHQGQAGRHATLLGELDAAVESFFATVTAAGAADRVVLMTASEFGRRAASNGSGTDHGTAAAHLIVGPAVAGGRHGAAVDLARLDPRGNPVHTVDFRSIYATVLRGWLGADDEAVLGGRYESLPLLTARDRTRHGPR